MYGAELVNEISERVSHVLCHPTENPHRIPGWKEMNRQRQVGKFYLVEPSWVADSIAKGHLAEELSYFPM